MKLDITTPSLFFPTVSLLMLAYTNRFLALASVIRQLHSQYKVSPNRGYLNQISNLRTRIKLVQNMQFLGVLSLLLCTACVFLIFLDRYQAAVIVFSASVITMIGSLVYSLLEIRLSVIAINLHLQDIEESEAEQDASTSP